MIPFCSDQITNNEVGKNSSLFVSPCSTLRISFFRVLNSRCRKNVKYLWMRELLPNWIGFISNGSISVWFDAKLVWIFLIGTIVPKSKFQHEIRIEIQELKCWLFVDAKKYCNFRREPEPQMQAITREQMSSINANKVTCRLCCICGKNWILVSCI